MEPIVEAVFDQSTWTVTYIVAEPDGPACAIIDSVLDYDPKSGRTRTESADKVVALIEHRNLKVEWILETHAHADHLTAAPYLQDRLGGKIAVGKEIIAVQSIFKDVFNTEPGFVPDGSQFDRLFGDGDTFAVGALQASVMHTPGHTPACVTYVFDNAAFIGDTMFMPDYGTARADFPGGDAATLYRSIHKILALPDGTRLFMCHDYLAPGRDEYEWETTVEMQGAHNVHIGGGVSEHDFVAMRNARDETLEMPVLLLPSVQVNIRAGKLPPAEANGVSYLKIPLNLL